ncbi:hypothetical protein [Mesobacillus foraminis]|uniref:hypothetical protein n=1 Tax=Mesobacillus foraminis TaxID=279826 RepID=UPI000EF4BB8E|nr:hypothetical protein [Mesobacillus foraminis]
MNDYTKKRMAANAVDILLTVAATLFYSFGVMIIYGIMAIFLSKSEHVNSVFTGMVLIFILPVLLGTLQVTYGAKFKVKQRKLFSQKIDVYFDFSRTRGQKQRQLAVKGSQLQTFFHWFLHNGIISILVYFSTSAYIYTNNLNNMFTWLTCLYGVFLLVNGFVYFRSSSGKSLLERITGTEIVDE